MARGLAVLPDHEPLQGRSPVTAYVGLGANLGDAQAAVRQAIQALAQLPSTQLIHCSSMYRTAALDSGAAPLAGTTRPEPDYVNAVAEISTRLPAPVLLDHLHALEQAAGRQRPYPNAPRTLDLDLLLYGSAVVQSTRLVLPHPRMYQRAFVLIPLAEITVRLVNADQLRAVALQRIERISHTRDEV